jgi:hypothetical protein
VGRVDLVPDVADLVVLWAQRVAGCPGGTSAELFAALGIPGVLVTSFGSELVDPPPPGMTEVRIHGGVASLATVDLRPASPITLADLDARLGARQELPRVHFDDPHTSAYEVVVTEPRSRCTVFVRSWGTAPDAVVASVLIRTEPRP